MSDASSEFNRDSEEGSQLWMKRKAQARNELKRIGNTLKEYRSLQRRDSPKASAELLAQPEGRPMRAESRRGLGGPLRVILTTLGIFLLSQFLAGLLVMIGQSLIRPRASLLDSLVQSAPLQFFYVFLAEVLAIALTVYVVREVRGVSLAAIGLGRLPKLHDVSRAFAGALAFYGLLILASVIVNLFFPDINTRESQDVGFSALNSSLDWVLAVVALVILPPLGEETLMRGYLYSGLRARWRFIPALLVTSLLFGLAHLGSGGDAPLWLAAVHTFLLSVVLVYLRERSGALYAGMLVHAANNAVAFGVTFR